MRYFKWIAIVLFSAVVLIGSLLIIVSISSRPPKQSKITDGFYVHRGAYEQLRRMLLEDKGVNTVATWGIRMNDSPLSKTPPDGMPVKRFQQYLVLLKEIGAERADQLEAPPGTSFGVWGSGWAGDTRHIDVCWLDREPDNTTSSLEAFYRTSKPRRPAYIHIEGNWYLWADW